MRQRGFSAREDLPLIGVITEDEGRQVVDYFVPGEDEERELTRETARDVRALAGVWSDLDWQSMVEELDSIRHEYRIQPDEGSR